MLKNVPLDQIPLCSEHLVELTQKKDVTEYTDLFFDEINRKMLNSKTIQKYNDLLFSKDVYGKDTTITNPNIYLINDQVLDNIISVAEETLNKKYNITEIYEDKEDLTAFEAKEPQRVERSKYD